ncbi:uncharacterized protein ANIA_11413 [Aspergillus nidulans FGSC A4]|uniref:Uncharacterized protein n=1 Tax=Emericella nidulans (strain FGSC A4 / ATCC 38163 / CBS 112.46 / NRRL 194 / M139) TaxID=227321 RepID=C8V728_EMENI|nr:hypothetical protein [Aspergillus nidulans FGSC A4]CBF75429.1 TPA: hypothetical protein ANIA_11413 [Aspergillus nidulans FGSC A4]
MVPGTPPGHWSSFALQGRVFQSRLQGAYLGHLTEENIE